MFSDSDVVILHRRNIELVLNMPKRTRDQLIYALPAYMGFRTQEIATLHWERTSLEEDLCYVLDSKKYRLFPIPIDWRVKQLLIKLAEETGSTGYVVKPISTAPNIRPGQPMSNLELQFLVKRYARKAGVIDWESYSPRLFRFYFAKMWQKEGRDMRILQGLLRHKRLLTSLHYVGKLVFLEDVEREFHRMRNAPEEANQNLEKIMLSRVNVE